MKLQKAVYSVKRLLLIGAISSLWGVTAFGQGTILFDNFVPERDIDGPFSTPDGKRIDGAQWPDARAALYAGPRGSAESTMVLIPPVVGFLSGAAAGYVDVRSSSIRALPIPSGGRAAVQIRFWFGGHPSFESAVAAGEWVGASRILNLTTGGNGSPPTPMIGLDAVRAVPEPASALPLLAGFAAIAIASLRSRS